MQSKLLDYCGTDDALTLKLRGGAVRRYHAEGRWVDQNVAEHTWRALIILLHLWPETSPDIIVQLIQHDIAEGYTGDVPAPVKRAQGVKAALDPIETEIEFYLGLDQVCGPADELLHLKLADYIEGALTCHDLLNLHWRAKTIRDKFIEYIAALLENASPQDKQVVNGLLVQQGLITVAQIPLRPASEIRVPRTEHPAPFGYKGDQDDEIPF